MECGNKNEIRMVHEISLPHSSIMHSLHSFLVPFIKFWISSLAGQPSSRRQLLTHLILWKTATLGRRGRLDPRPGLGPCPGLGRFPGRISFPNNRQRVSVCAKLQYFSFMVSRTFFPTITQRTNAKAHQRLNSKQASP